jgi:hypothetical protein
MGTASEVSYAAPVIKVSQEMDNPLKLALAVDVFVAPNAGIFCGLTYTLRNRDWPSKENPMSALFCNLRFFAPGIIKCANTHAHLAAPKNPSMEFK